MIKTILAGAAVVAAAMLGGPLVIAAGVEAVQTPPQQAQQQAPPTQKPELTNINTADAETLQKLPGIGPATAKSIIEYREQNEGFKKVEELMNVRGVGEKTFLKLKDLITVGPPKFGSA